jgi:protein-ribulosamine 3-kinase
MNALDESITRALGSNPVEARPVGGGCIHDARCLVLADGRRVFLKSARGETADLLEAEARGLVLLAPHIRVPRLIDENIAADGTRWLALEWLDLVPPGAAAWTDLGRQLAALHSITADCFGLDHDNFIGATPQTNRWAGTWLEFYQERRLRPQIRLARSRGHDLPEGEILAAAGRILADHVPAASLLHGDLWSGNTRALTDSTAVVFDPACYFGDAETDLAMLELFGGPLPDSFLRGYGPSVPGRERRRPLYDLYHALNHLNLFGSGYVAMVRRCIDAIRC